MDLAVKHIAYGISKSDAQRIFSIQKDLVGLHGTRVSLETLRIRMIGIQSRRAKFSGSVAEQIIDEDPEE
jgi:hypothetical protein